MARLPIHREEHVTDRTGWLRAAVLGANDGLLSTASLVLGVAAAGGTQAAVLTAGIAGLAAGAMSMASGEYVSVSSQRDAERADLARERGDQRPERFAVGQKVDARVTQFDRKTHKVGVSIKALEVAEEKEAMAQYGSADSGASLGDILGAALKQRAGENADDEKAD